MWTGSAARGYSQARSAACADWGPWATDTRAAASFSIWSTTRKARRCRRRSRRWRRITGASSGDRFGVVFNQLLTLANMPIQRFGAVLIAKGEFETYMDLLRNAHRDANLDGVMCRGLISVDWRGYLYDCDFNQMLDLPLTFAARRRGQIEDLLEHELGRQPNPSCRTLLRLYRRPRIELRWRPQAHISIMCIMRPDSPLSRVTPSCAMALKIWHGMFSVKENRTGVGEITAE